MYYHINFVHSTVLVYMDVNGNNESSLPSELKEKYTLSKMLGRWIPAAFQSSSLLKKWAIVYFDLFFIRSISLYRSCFVRSVWGAFLSQRPGQTVIVFLFVYSRGACGEVRLAFVKGNCKKVAVKIIQKSKFSSTAANLVCICSTVSTASYQ